MIGDPGAPPAPRLRISLKTRVHPGFVLLVVVPAVLTLLLLAALPAAASPGLPVPDVAVAELALARPAPPRPPVTKRPAELKPTPTPRPTPTPTPRPTPVVVQGGGNLTERPSAASPSSAAIPGATPSPSAAGDAIGGPADGDHGSLGPAPGGPGAGSPDDPAVAGPFGRDEMSRLITVTATVSTGTTLFAAFLLFGWRRRRGDRDDRDLAIAAASGLGGPLSGAPAVARQAAVDPGTGGTDVDLPRWRRPSLLAARKSDPIRYMDAGDAGHLSFVGAAATAGAERRLVRYRIVRLLDRPDELLGSTVGSVDEGDQVAVVEQSGLYRRIETPDGRSGWLHKMTLGDVVAESAGQEAEVDPDVLMAYLAVRSRG